MYLTQHDMHASSVSYIMWNSQEEGWDDSGSWDAAAWMARRREALLFQSMVHCHTPWEHWGTKPKRRTVPSALPETPAALTAPFSWNFWGEWHSSWSFQLLSWAISSDPSSLQQPRLQREFPCPTYLWVIHKLSFLVPMLAAPWLSPAWRGLFRILLQPATVGIENTSWNYRAMSDDVVEMEPTLLFSLLVAFQFQHRIWLIKVDFPKTFVNDLCSFFSINFKGLREVWTMTLNILTCSFESISGHAC